MNLNDLQKLINEKSLELARKRNEIIEAECKKVMEKYNCSGCELILEFHSNDEISIRLHGSTFQIINNFIIEDALLK